MSRFARIRRRPDHWASPHERARARAAERLDGPLGLSEATWLDEHLAACADCTAIAAAYDADRAALRSLRDAPLEPPRDLWARTAAAIERESHVAGRARPATTGAGGRRIPVGILSSVAVIAVVVAVSAVSGGLFDGSVPETAITVIASPSPVPTAAGTDAASSPIIAAAAPTPFDVGAGDVQWFGKDPDGQLAYNAASIRKVCPVDSVASCATVDDSVADRLPMSAAPKSIIGSPTQQQAVVVSDDGAGGQQVTVLSLPAEDASPSPSVAPTARPSSGPSTAPPTAQPTSGAATPTATAPASPTAPATTEPPASAQVTESPAVTASPSLGPSATPEATASTEPTIGPTDQPTLTPAPTLAATLAIASDITVVGESAAFSADGEWFAFTARPTDGSHGPDVYVWHVGDKSAHQLTRDGATFFGSWDGDTVVVSRAQPVGDTVGPETSVDPSASATPTPEPTPAVTTAITTSIDPKSGDEHAAGDLWRPVVDPTNKRAVGWAGTVAYAPDGLGVVPSDGRLELRRWTTQDGASTGSGPSQIVARGPITDFDVRWDESGSWFAVWVADPSGTEVGRLSLFRVDPATGLLEHPKGAPADVAALPGFSIGQGRLAWATPPGQGGEGSRVQIVAWASDGVGAVETAPGEDLIVVR